jgi:UDP-N-acetylglucosamine diphosphorylase / glucose-1-phosphate thymidylyltransferase / UDP-N-acetylgalactosamine diphosphorylase / glucosamine-1-phosphate N-acetyltransferase / galactosamine-1-phosphate N-acetyltransferase
MECVVLAAGEGKRMRPLTAKRPKVMLPLANRPMMEHLVIAARDAGITGFVFVVGYGEREVRNYFGDGSRWGIRIRYAPQRYQQGTADALNAARGYVKGKFLLLNGDMMLQSADIRALCEHEAPCMGTSATDHPEDYGVIAVEGGYVTALEEKSSHPKSSTINAGAYVIEPDIFEHIDAVVTSARGELELTDALVDYIRNKKLRACPVLSWMDVGYPWDMLEANGKLMASAESKNEGTFEREVSCSGPVVIGRGTVVKSGTCIEGPCVIGSNCRIGPHAYIRGATAIGDNCHIGHCTELKNSIVMPHTKIPHFNYVGDSIIGSGCNFGAGTKIANLRHDQATIKVAGKDSRRKKFGAIIGDGVQFGINCSVNVGAVIGTGAKFAPNSYIEGLIGENSFIR